jgi:hypothetical protein
MKNCGSYSFKDNGEFFMTPLVYEQEEMCSRWLLVLIIICSISLCLFNNIKYTAVLTIHKIYVLEECNITVRNIHPRNVVTFFGNQL